MIKGRFINRMNTGRNTRKSVKSIKMPRGLTSFQKSQYLRNATRRARANAHRRGTPFVQGSVRLPIDELKSVNRHLNALLSAYEDEQDSGRYGDVIDTISMIFHEISSDILRVKADLPNLYSSKYPELSSDSEEHIFERMEELVTYNKSVIRGGDNELAKKILRIIRKAFFNNRVSNLTNMNSSNSNNSNSNNSIPAVKDELDTLMDALSGMRF